MTHPRAICCTRKSDFDDLTRFPPINGRGLSSAEAAAKRCTRGNEMMDDDNEDAASDPTAAENVGADGNYVVGKNKPPKKSQFRVGDGRVRGRRPEGTRNLATDLREVLEEHVPGNIGGKIKSITNQEAVVRVAVNGAKKGIPRFSEMIFKLQQAIVEPLIVNEINKEDEKKKPDFSRLSVNEMRALEYLLLKASGEPTSPYAPTITITPYKW
jgi:hypothetical protein